MSNIDISALSEHFCAQFERLQAAEQEGDASKLKKEISRTRAIIEVSKRIILNAHFIHKCSRTVILECSREK